MNKANKIHEKSILIIFILLIRKYWKYLITLSLSISFLMLIISFFIKNQYEAKTTLIPMETENESLRALMSSKIPILFKLGGMSSGTVTTQNKILFILESYSVAQNIINEFKLGKYLFPSKWDNKINSWKHDKKKPSMDALVNKFHKKIIDIKTNKKGLITIKILLPDAKLASLVANAIVNELGNFMNDKLISRAKKNRIFIEKQLKKAETELNSLEEEIKLFEKKNKIYNIKEQTKLSLEEFASITSRLIDNNIELEQIEKTYGKNNPSYKKLKLLQSILTKQLLSLKKTPPNTTPVFGRLEEIPDLKISYRKLQRNAAIQEKIFSLLKEQLEIAKINEAQYADSFQVIDPAHIPMEPAWPKRKMLTIVSFITSFMLFLFIFFIREYVLPEIRSSLD